MKTISYILATGLGSGYAPKAPGTAGTILALIIAWFFFSGDPLITAIAALLATLIGIPASKIVGEDCGEEDPSIVVIDEVAGMWVSLLWVPHDPLAFLICFGLFRLFDIFKPQPVRYMERFTNGVGVMMDDVVAGIYAAITTHIVVYFVL